MADIGLDCTVNSGLKVFGIFKHLWEDFHVREISRDGTVLQLNHLLDQEIIRQGHLENLEEEAGCRVLNSEFRISSEAKSRLQQECHFDDESIDTLERFIRAVARVKDALKNIPTEGVVTPAEIEEAAYQGLCKCHGVILPPSNISFGDSKIARKAMHEVIRDLYPFVETETTLTGDLYDRQQKPTLEVGQTDGMADECADAAGLATIYEPKDYLLKLGLSPASESTLLDKMLKFDYKAHKASVKDTSGADVIKFLTLKLKKVAIHHLVGRSLRSAPSSKDSSVKWNSTKPPYLHFTLMKQNRDISEAVQSISSALGVGDKLISYAGTKDKRGCTVQRMSLSRITKSRLLTCSTYRSWDRALKVSDLEYSNRRVTLGDLKGNHFTLAIRRIPASLITGSEPGAEESELKSGRDAVAEHISRLVQGIKEKGFINYYGNQRFGTRKIRTWHVGEALFRRDYQQAVVLILRAAINLPELGENETQDWSAVESQLRNHHNTEKKMVKHLKDHPNEYSGALRKLHKNMLALYYHALQSLVWNKLASERIRTFGLRIVPGDIVILPLESAVDEPTAPEPAADEADEEVLADLTGIDDDRECKFAVKLIESEEEAANYNLTDLCLPLPGPGVIYPANLTDAIEVLYQQYLNMTPAAVLELDSNRHLVAIEGSYRRVIVKPDNVAHKILHDVEEQHSVLASDLDRLLGRPISKNDDFTTGLKPLTCQLNVEPNEDDDSESASEPTTRAAESDVTNISVEAVAMDERTTAQAPSTAAEINSDVEEKQNPISDVLLFACSLPKGSYLTCLLRELLDDASIADFAGCKDHKFFKRQEHQTKDSARSWKRGAPKRGGPNKRRR